MKAVFVSYNQAYNQEIVDILESNGQRGYTNWEDVQGRGGVDGEPHLGSHAWPVLNFALLSVMEDDKVAKVIADLKAKDASSPDLGLRAFVWSIEQAV